MVFISIAKSDLVAEILYSHFLPNRLHVIGRGVVNIIYETFFESLVHTKLLPTTLVLPDM